MNLKDEVRYLKMVVSQQGKALKEQSKEYNDDLIAKLENALAHEKKRNREMEICFQN
jgi:hypothetical protein